MKPAPKHHASFPRAFLSLAEEPGLGQASPLYLVCARSGKLLAWEGDPGGFGLPQLHPEALVQDELDPLLGIFPLVGLEPLVLPGLTTAGGPSFDLLVLPAGRKGYVLLRAAKEAGTLHEARQLLHEAALRRGAAKRPARKGRSPGCIDAARQSGGPE